MTLSTADIPGTSSRRGNRDTGKSRVVSNRKEGQQQKGGPVTADIVANMEKQRQLKCYQPYENSNRRHANNSRHCRNLMDKLQQQRTT